MDSTPTNRDNVTFRIPFQQSVLSSVSLEDFTALGTLAGSVQLSLIDHDPVYEVVVSMDDPNAEGTIGISFTGSVTTTTGIPVGVPINSPLYTIQNPLGDKNDDGDVEPSELNEVILEFRNLNP
jgi:hypothetical protein